MTCIVDGCENPIRNISRSLCNKHHLRLLRHGTLEANFTEQGEPLSFLKNIAPSEDCISWPYAKNEHGYGKVQYEGRMQLASRISCIIWHGEPPKDQVYEAAHSCGKGKSGCVNPNHLYWATRSQNEADKIGHETSNHGSRNGMAKLTEEDVREIKWMKRNGMPGNKIAAHFPQVTYWCIRDILNGNRWPHVTI